MNTRRVKLVWGASRVIRARWILGLCGFYERIPGVPGSGFAVSLRGVLVWSLALLVAAYVAGATALFAVWRRNPYSQLTYADALLYPARRAEITERKGRAYLAEGTALFRQQKYVDAANLLRLGLARYPQDLSARLLLAQFYLMANQRPVALKVLQEGLSNEYPGRTYLEVLFRALDEGEDFAGVNEVATRYVPRLTGDSLLRDRRWLEGRKVGALIAAGRAGEALTFAQTLPPGDRASEHQVIALLSLGRRDEALTRVDEWTARSGADRLVAIRLRARVCRELGRLEDMEAALAEVRRLSPGEPGALVYGVVQRAMAGQGKSAQAALDDYIFRFGGSLANVILVAQPLAEIKDLGLLRRCAAAAAERGLPADRLNVLQIDVNVAQGHWKQAAALLSRVPVATGQAAATARVWRDWMQRLIEAADSPADTGQLALLELMRTRSWPVGIYRRTAESLLLAGRTETARDTVQIALRAFPAHAGLQQMAEDVRLRMTAAPPASRDSAADPVLVERVFFPQLEAAVKARQWDQADALVRQARAARPAPKWVESRDADLWLAQIRSAQARADSAGLLSATRQYLRRGGRAHAVRLLEVAREFHGAGDKPAAVAVTREVLRRFPAFPPAERQLAEWDPAPKS